MFHFVTKVFQNYGTNVTLWISLITLLVTYIYYDVRKKQNFWEKMGVPFIKPRFFVGSLEMMSSKSLAEKLQTIYRTYPDAR